MRIIIITGKGGVGKTSIAAATAVHASKRGARTLVMSTDSAHSLSDSFDMKLGAEPTPIADNLEGQEVDARSELMKEWGNIKNFVRSTMQSRGIDRVAAEELSVFPGMEELFSMLLLKNYYRENVYDIIIIDCAPTAQTIRLLSFPEVFNWYLQKIFPIQRQVARLARPVAKRLYDVDLPGEGVFEDIRNLVLSLDGMKEILTDNRITTVRLVVNLEKMVIREAQRAYTYMNLFGYTVDAVFINRIFPEELDARYLEQWKALQKNYMQSVEESFSGAHFFKAPLFREEIIGMEKLERFGETIFGEINPAAVLCNDRPIAVEEKEGKFLLRWRIPGVKKEEIKLFTRGEDLILETPGFMRNMLLPSVLIGKEILQASYKDDHLVISFS